MSSLAFGLPPSLGRAAWDLARELATIVDRVDFETVVPFTSYAALEDALRRGEVHAAWAPPLVCARVEAAGSPAVLRGVRAGEVTYRSVLVCRRDGGFPLEALRRGTYRPRVAWVDALSMAGYLLPRAHLRGIGVPWQSAFLQQRMLGSYAACLDALLGQEADLTAVYPGALGARAGQVNVLATTAASPTDAVVISPAVSGELAAHLRAALGQLRARRSFAAVFGVDGFDEPPPGTYAPLLALG